MDQRSYKIGQGSRITRSQGVTLRAGCSSSPWSASLTGQATPSTSRSPCIRSVGSKGSGESLPLPLPPGSEDRKEDS